MSEDENFLFQQVDSAVKHGQSMPVGYQEGNIFHRHQRENSERYYSSQSAVYGIGSSDFSTSNNNGEASASSVSSSHNTWAGGSGWSRGTSLQGNRSSGLGTFVFGCIFVWILVYSVISIFEYYETQKYKATQSQAIDEQVAKFNRDYPVITKGVRYAKTRKYIPHIPWPDGSTIVQYVKFEFGTQVEIVEYLDNGMVRFVGRDMNKKLKQFPQLISANYFTPSLDPPVNSQQNNKKNNKK